MYICLHHKCRYWTLVGLDVLVLTLSYPYNVRANCDQNQQIPKIYICIFPSLGVGWLGCWMLVWSQICRQSANTQPGATGRRDYIQLRLNNKAQYNKQTTNNKQQTGRQDYIQLRLNNKAQCNKQQTTNNK